MAIATSMPSCAAWTGFSGATWTEGGQVLTPARPKAAEKLCDWATAPHAIGAKNEPRLIPE